MIDYLRQVFEQRLVEVLEQARYEELEPRDVSRILKTVDVVLEAPSLVQGARDLIVFMDDRAELELLSAEDPERRDAT